jgi:hypothetical protein
MDDTLSSEVDKKMLFNIKDSIVQVSELIVCEVSLYTAHIGLSMGLQGRPPLR